MKTTVELTLHRNWQVPVKAYLVRGGVHSASVEVLKTPVSSSAASPGNSSAAAVAVRSSDLVDFLTRDSVDAVHEYDARSCQSPAPSEQPSLSETPQFLSATFGHKQVFISRRPSVLYLTRTADEVRCCI